MLLAPHKRTLKLMGNSFTITVVSSIEEAQYHIDAAVKEIQRIEEILSTYKPDSEVSQINKNAGIAPVQVSQELINLTLRAKQLSILSHGIFDITYGAISDDLWNFNQQMQKLPAKNQVMSRLHLVDYKRINVDAQQRTIYLPLKGMKLNFGGIGKGYAADAAKQLLIDRGVNAGVVNASGDLITWGEHPSTHEWHVSVAHPDDTRFPFTYLNARDLAVATSGNYEKVATINGKKYSHTIDPRTVLPIQGVKSVTTICRCAEFADAMATPIMVLGVKNGLQFVNSIPGLAAIIVDADNVIHLSNNITLDKLKR